MTGQAASVYINHLLSARHWVLIPGPEMPPCAALAPGLGCPPRPTPTSTPHPPPALGTYHPRAPGQERP